MEEETIVDMAGRRHVSPESSSAVLHEKDNQPLPPTYRFSCVDCRRRKIKCNKVKPCSNCTRTRQTCNFPMPRRSSKESSSSQQANPELLSKIRHLEDVITSLRATVAQKGSAHQELLQEVMQLRAAQPAAPATENAAKIAPPNAPSSSSNSTQKVYAVPSVDNMENRSVGSATTPNAQGACPSLSPQSESSSNFKPGSLIRDEGRMLYVGDSFWSIVSAQSESSDNFDFDALEEEQEEDTAAAVSPDAPPPANNSFLDMALLGPRSTIPTETMHPTPENRQKLWRVFKASIDPIFKVLHMPTVEVKLDKWLYHEDTDGIPKSTNTILWSVYFSAVTSMEKDVCQGLLHLDQDKLICEFRAGVEGALIDAGLLNTDNLLVIQAFIIYLVTVRRYNPRLSWTLCSLAFRLLQSMGAHRIGASLSLPIFESEMYRRLIWHVCVLECGAAEDCGCNPTIFEMSSFDVPLPRNVNDSDLNEDMTAEPEARSEWTDSTLLILWAEAITLWRASMDKRYLPVGRSKTFHAMNPKEKSDFIHENIVDFEGRYSAICSPLVPLQWVTVTMSRLLVLEFKIAAVKPLKRYNELDQAEYDDMFHVSLECLELTNKLHVDRRSVRWVWLLTTFTVWQALAFVLTCLGAQPLRKEYQNAWRVAEQAIVSRWQSAYNSWGHQWRSMLSLYATAQKAKATQSRRRRPASIRLNRADVQPAAPVGEEVPAAGAAASLLPLNVPAESQQQQQQEKQTQPPRQPLSPVSRNGREDQGWSSVEEAAADSNAQGRRHYQPRPSSSFDDLSLMDHVNLAWSVPEPQKAQQVFSDEHSRHSATDDGTLFEMHDFRELHDMSPATARGNCDGMNMDDIYIVEDFKVHDSITVDCSSSHDVPEMSIPSTQDGMPMEVED